MALTAIALPGADLRFDPHWLAAAEADVLLATLRASVPWETHRIRLFGREVDSPRLSCWIGDAGTHYVYSGARFDPHPWPDALRPLRARLDAVAGVHFNSVLANLYRDGRDAMGWHSDDEPELGAAPVIASLSLGVPRRFVFKRRVARGAPTPAAALALALTHGSLLLMAGATQANYRHALPRSMRIADARINLTFRAVDPGARRSPRAAR